MLTCSPVIAPEVQRMSETIEQEIARWHECAHSLHHPDPGDRLIAGKLNEEAGEVFGALTKLFEGRGSVEAVRGELGDVALCLAVIAGRNGWTIDELLHAKWVEHGTSWRPRHSAGYDGEHGTT